MASAGREEMPWWGYASALLLMTSAMVASAAIGYAVAWGGDSAELEEHRALFEALSLASVVEESGAGSAQTYIESLERAPLEAFVIAGGQDDEFGISRGQAYLVAHDKNLRGVTLFDRVAAGGDRDKIRADRYALSTSGVQAKRRPGRARPEYVLEREQVGGREVWSAQVPVFDRGGRVQGSAGVSLVKSVPGTPTPWVMLLVGLLLAALLGLGFRQIQLSEPVRLNALRAAIAVLGLGLLTLTMFHYQSTYSEAFTESAELTAMATRAAEAANVAGAAGLVAKADLTFVGEAGFLFKGGQLKVATLLSGRSAVPFVSVAVVLLAMLLLSGRLVKLMVGLKEETIAYFYVLPSLMGMVLLVFVPFGVGVGMSLFDNDARRYYYVGLDNFVEILSSGATSDVSFYWTLFVTVLWTVTNVFLHVAVGLGLALLLKDPLLKFRGVYRVLLIVPWAVPSYITALIWKGMFNKEFGAVNQALEAFQSFLGMQPAGIDWLGGGFVTAFTANLVTNTWLGFPFMMVVSLGALQSIPGSLYEAAEVDGASKWQQFRTITLPLLKPALFPAIIMGSIWTFNMFNVIYLVSGGGPNNSTEILITDAYRAFDVLGRYGFAAAYSVLIFLILFVYTMITNRITRATEGAFE